MERRERATAAASAAAEYEGVQPRNTRLVRRGDGTCHLGTLISGFGAGYGTADDIACNLVCCEGEVLLEPTYGS